MESGAEPGPLNVGYKAPHGVTKARRYKTSSVVSGRVELSTSLNTNSFSFFGNCSTMAPFQSRPTETSHPDIGVVQCLSVGEVTQLLGVKYASLEHWFDNPKLCTYDGSGITARKHG